MRCDARCDANCCAGIDAAAAVHAGAAARTGRRFCPCAWRSRPKQGAGTLVHVGRFDLAEFALVLEPEEPLRAARRALLRRHGGAGRRARRHAPPETPIDIEWPDAIYVNLGLVGGGRLAWPRRRGEDEVPPWLVFGAMIRTVSMTGDEPGARSDVTALEEEGFARHHRRATLIESFARQFHGARSTPGRRAASARWRRDYLRAACRAAKALRRDIDDNGDLLRAPRSPARSSATQLLPALAAPSWFDPATQGPRA